MKRYLISIALLSSLSFGNNLNEAIYGVDSRRDLYEINDTEILDLAKATAVMVENKKIKGIEEGEKFRLVSKTYGQLDQLCPEEKYRNQIAPGDCSGFLVKDNILVTAGHCITKQADCDNYSWIFDFGVFEEGQDGNKQGLYKNVYTCKEIIVRKEDDKGPDFSIIKLDRRVVGRKPVKVRESGTLTNTEELLLIGNPAGIPTKVTDGAYLRSHRPGFFIANIDAYGGNSGSAVFNKSTGEVEGILVRGTYDFRYDKVNSCYRTHVCKDNGCMGEDVTAASSFVNYLK